MPRVKKHKARQNIYHYGVKTTDTTKKQGYTVDRSQPRDAEDKLIVAKGQEYWTWQFKNSPRQYSLTPPDKRQLTRSDYQLAIYDIEDEIAGVEATTVEDLEAAVESLKEQIETLRDEQEEKRENMPDGLREGSVGELLQERYDALDNAYTELDNIDLDYPEPDEGELIEEIESELDEGEDYDDEKIEEKRQEKLDEWIQEKLEEIQSIGLDG